MIYESYTVRVKDLQQDITHTLHEYASSQNAANASAVTYLRKALRHNQFEIVGKRKPLVKNHRKEFRTYTNYMDAIKVPRFDNNAWKERSKASMAKILQRHNNV